MQVHNVVQGSQEWLALRAKHFCASEAPAMLGLSKRLSRNDLLRMKATGDEREFSAWVRDNVLANGHAAEAAARPQIEAFMQEDLYPCTGTDEVDGLPLLASFDGITMDEGTVWENKLANADLVAALGEGIVGDEYWPQLEQQLLVSGASRAYFTAADGDGAVLGAVWYESVPERRAKVIAGWRLFAEDLANYKHVEVLPAAVAAPIEDLPALTVEISGRVLSTNLTAWQDIVKARIQAIKTDLKDDNDFATAEKTVKFLEDGEKRLTVVKAQAQAQAADIDTLFRAIDAIAAEMRVKRLELDKLVKARKESIRGEKLLKGQQDYAAHIATLNKRLGKPYMPMTLPVDFAGAMKGKKTVKSLQDAVDAELTRAKLAANEVADKIEINLKDFTAYGDYGFLFPDLDKLVLKPSDDFANAVTTRWNDHRRREAEKEEAERIRREYEAARAAQAQTVSVSQPAGQPAQQTAAQPSAQAVQAPSGGQPQESAVAAAMTTGRLHDLIDEATQFMTAAELQAVLDFARAVMARRPKAA